MHVDFWCSFSILWDFNLGGAGDGEFIWVVVGIFWVVMGGGGQW